MTQQDMFTRDFAEAARVEAAMAEGRAQNVRLFTKMWLSLGADVRNLTGNRHDQELLEARHLAARRWEQLLSMEQQIVREEQQLAARPKTRPATPGDEVLPDRTLAQRDAEWLDATKYRRNLLAELKEQAKTERRTLDSFITKAR
jgi:hypothetical protein